MFCTSSKANVVDDFLRQIYMNDICHVEDERKELICDDHKLSYVIKGETSMVLPPYVSIVTIMTC